MHGRQSAMAAVPGIRDPAPRTGVQHTTRQRRRPFRLRTWKVNSPGPTGVTAADPSKVAASRPRGSRSGFRRDKLPMIAFAVVVGYLLVAIAAPFLVMTGVLTPVVQQQRPDGNSGGSPIGHRRCEGDHSLGVEPAPVATCSPRLAGTPPFPAGIALVGHVHRDRLPHGPGHHRRASAAAGPTDHRPGRRPDPVLPADLLMPLALSSQGVASWPASCRAALRRHPPKRLLRRAVLGSSAGWESRASSAARCSRCASGVRGRSGPATRPPDLLRDP